MGDACGAPFLSLDKAIRLIKLGAAAGRTRPRCPCRPRVELYLLPDVRHGAGDEAGHCTAGAAAVAGTWMIPPDESTARIRARDELLRSASGTIPVRSGTAVLDDEGLVESARSSWRSAASTAEIRTVTGICASPTSCPPPPIR